MNNFELIKDYLVYINFENVNEESIKQFLFERTNKCKKEKSNEGNKMTFEKFFIEVLSKFKNFDELKKDSNKKSENEPS